MKTITLTAKRVELKRLTWVQSNVPGTCVVVTTPQKFTKDERMKVANVLALLGTVEFPDGSTATLRGKEDWAEFTKHWVAQQALYVRVQQTKKAYVMPDTFPKALKEVGFVNMAEVIEYGKNVTQGYYKLDASKVITDLLTPTEVEEEVPLTKEEEELKELTTWYEGHKETNRPQAKTITKYRRLIQLLLKK